MVFPASTLSGQLLTAIDAVCERFEDQLQAGASARAEDFLPPDWQAEDRAQLVAYLLRIEVEFRTLRGENPTEAEYRVRLGELPEELRTLFHPLPATLHDPKILGPYRIVAKLGAGGMGQVYQAFQPRLHRFVAIKVLPAGLLGDPAARRRFDRELEAAGKVSHPNVITAFDAGQAGDVHYLVMELVEGFNLADLVRRASPLAIANSCELIRQASLGLAQVHKQGLVHRDIKPANLMLGPDGQVKILDLGLALLHERQATEGDPELTSAGQMMGTFDYMPPEQCVDSHAVDGRADVYALGATLFRLLAGRAPFAHRHSLTPVGRLSAKLQETPPSLTQFRNDIPAPLAALVEQMLAREPQQRVASAAQVAKQLEPFCNTADLEALFETAGRPPEPAALSDTATHGPTVANLLATELSGPQPPTFARWPWLAFLLVGSVVAILAGIFFLQTKNGTVRVEINDPKIVAQISGEKVTLRTADGGKDISLSPGERKLLVERDGFRFETSHFEIRSGGTVSLRVDLLDGQIVVRDGEKIIGSEKIPTPPRKIEPMPAELVKPIRPEPPLEPIPQPAPAAGKVPGPNASEKEIAEYLKTELHAELQMKAVDPLKPDDLKITWLRWGRDTSPPDDAYAPAAGLRHLEHLGLGCGNKGLLYFQGCKGLKSLRLCDAGIDGEGAKFLVNFPELELVQIPCYHARAFLQEIKKHPNIRRIESYKCGLRNEDVELLIDMRQLRSLEINADISSGQMSADAIKHLAQMQQLETLRVHWPKGPSEIELQELRTALPKCKVNQP